MILYGFLKDLLGKSMQDMYKKQILFLPKFRIV